jgi:hypothetical protein
MFTNGNLTLGIAPKYIGSRTGNVPVQSGGVPKALHLLSLTTNPTYTAGVLKPTRFAIQAQKKEKQGWTKTEDTHSFVTGKGSRSQRIVTQRKYLKVINGQPHSAWVTESSHYGSLKLGNDESLAYDTGLGKFRFTKIALNRITNLRAKWGGVPKALHLLSLTTNPTYTAGVLKPTRFAIQARKKEKQGWTKTEDTHSFVTGKGSRSQRVVTQRKYLKVINGQPHSAWVTESSHYGSLKLGNDESLAYDTELGKFRFTKIALNRITNLRAKRGEASHTSGHVQVKHKWGLGCPDMSLLVYDTELGKFSLKKIVQKAVKVVKKTAAVTAGGILGTVGLKGKGVLRTVGIKSKKAVKVAQESGKVGQKAAWVAGSIAAAYIAAPYIATGSKFVGAKLLAGGKVVGGGIASGITSLFKRKPKVAGAEEVAPYEGFIPSLLPEIEKLVAPGQEVPQPGVSPGPEAPQPSPIPGGGGGYGPEGGGYVPGEEAAQAAVGAKEITKAETPKWVLPVAIGAGLFLTATVFMKKSPGRA